jgi:hypothetical protein
LKLIEARPQVGQALRPPSSGVAKLLHEDPRKSVLKIEHGILIYPRIPHGCTK